MRRNFNKLSHDYNTTTGETTGETVTLVMHSIGQMDIKIAFSNRTWRWESTIRLVT